jgi:hypothetical protein
MGYIRQVVNQSTSIATSAPASGTSPDKGTLRCRAPLDAFVGVEPLADDVEDEDVSRDEEEDENEEAAADDVLNREDAATLALELGTIVGMPVIVPSVLVRTTDAGAPLATLTGTGRLRVSDGTGDANEPRIPVNLLRWSG